MYCDFSLFALTSMDVNSSGKRRKWPPLIEKIRLFNVVGGCSGKVKMYYGELIFCYKLLMFGSFNDIVTIGYRGLFEDAITKELT